MRAANVSWLRLSWLPGRDPSRPSGKKRSLAQLEIRPIACSGRWSWRDKKSPGSAGSINPRLVLDPHRKSHFHKVTHPCAVHLTRSRTPIESQINIVWPKPTIRQSGPTIVAQLSGPGSWGNQLWLGVLQPAEAEPSKSVPVGNLLFFFSGVFFGLILSFTYLDTAWNGHPLGFQTHGWVHVVAFSWRSWKCPSGLHLEPRHTAHMAHTAHSSQVQLRRGPSNEGKTWKSVDVWLTETMSTQGEAAKRIALTPGSRVSLGLVGWLWFKLLKKI